MTPAAVPVERGAIRRWWADLTRPTRVLVAVNGVVVCCVGAVAAALPLFE